MFKNLPEIRKFKGRQPHILHPWLFLFLFLQCSNIRQSQPIIFQDYRKFQTEPIHQLLIRTNPDSACFSTASFSKSPTVVSLLENDAQMYRPAFARVKYHVHQVQVIDISIELFGKVFAVKNRFSNIRFKPHRHQFHLVKRLNIGLAPKQRSHVRRRMRVNRPIEKWDKKHG